MGLGLGFWEAMVLGRSKRSVFLVRLKLKFFSTSTFEEEGGDRLRLNTFFQSCKWFWKKNILYQNTLTHSEGLGFSAEKIDRYKQ